MMVLVVVGFVLGLVLGAAAATYLTMIWLSGGPDE